MKLNDKEAVAVINLAVQMMLADGYADDDEKLIIARESVKLGITNFNEIFLLAVNMKAQTAIAIVSEMDNEQKKYVSSFLACIAAADGNLDDSEFKLMRFITTICDLPIPSEDEFREFMKPINL